MKILQNCLIALSNGILWWDALGEMKAEAIKRIHIASMRAKDGASQLELCFWIGNIMAVSAIAVTRWILPIGLGILGDRVYLYVTGRL